MSIWYSKYYDKQCRNYMAPVRYLTATYIYTNIHTHTHTCGAIDSTYGLAYSLAYSSFATYDIYTKKFKEALHKQQKRLAAAIATQNENHAT